MIYSKRIIGLDVGSKRIGMAHSDPTRTIATAVGTYPESDLFSKLESDRNKIERIVVGWPLSMRGHEGASTEMVKSFNLKLQKKLPDITIELLDERFTSVLANQSLLQTVSAKKRRENKGLVDAVAAAILLQSYLDRLNKQF